jgi:hypothetical protein
MQEFAFFGLGMPELIVLALLGFMCLVVPAGVVVLVLVLTRRKPPDRLEPPARESAAGE